MRIGVAWSAIALSIAGSSGCAPLTTENSVTARLGEYFREHREVPPEIAAAMLRGHVAAGMNQQQVAAVLGKPLRAVRHTNGRLVEVWTYPGHRLHQGHFATDGAALVRVVFVEGRVELIEPM